MRWLRGGQTTNTRANVPHNSENLLLGRGRCATMISERGLVISPGFTSSILLATFHICFPLSEASDLSGNLKERPRAALRHVLVRLHSLLALAEQCDFCEDATKLIASRTVSPHQVHGSHEYLTVLRATAFELAVSESICRTMQGACSDLSIPGYSSSSQACHYSQGKLMPRQLALQSMSNAWLEAEGFMAKTSTKTVLPATLVEMVNT
ncbi:hypothetical protein P171DRAFT_161036 [Karstenula rhodostoma CBS 690.94]|uniref:Uncharacterized protein n=1 Tax=Karstenula rhodostoma CBS 690.94 TaxID=1392251 RepID=A0A9P4P6S4_9PLEO|nr:hypothetical protein P171DRAFT_161036 [Karstenula rhodostoma CBS 690.94]